MIVFIIDFFFVNVDLSNVINVISFNLVGIMIYDCFSCVGVVKVDLVFLLFFVVFFFIFDLEVVMCIVFFRLILFNF